MRAIDASHYLLDLEIQHRDLPNGYPFDLRIIKHIDKLVFHPQVTFLVGENGTGKSTLIEAIAVAMGLNAEGGSKNFRFSTTETHSQLHNYLKLSKGVKRAQDNFFLRAETFYNVASYVDNLAKDTYGTNRSSFMSSYGGNSLHRKSHGESFIALIENRFKGNGLYILDEPEAALSPFNQFKLLALMQRLIRHKSQFIIATHSPILMGYPDADIYLLGKDATEKVDYEATPHYQLTKYFLNHREEILKELLEE